MTVQADLDLEEELLEGGDGPPPRVPRNGGDDNGGGESSFGEPHFRPLCGNAYLAMSLFLGMEALFFAGLVSAYLFLRLKAPVWPPPGQPRLPVVITGMNTLLLLSSGYAMWRALQAVRRGDQKLLVRALTFTFLLGGVFLAAQGSEWVRLLRFGFTAASGTYGGTFYTLIGIHGFHVLGAMIWLGLTLAAARRGRFTARNHVGLSLCGMYWFFVVALWPILYGLVYLA